MTLVVGLGSPHGDDRLGWVAVERLRPRLPAGVLALALGSGLELLDCLGDHDRAVVIDAVSPAGRPGTIRCFDWPCPELAARAPGSTHGLGLVEALRLAELLGRLPRRVAISTIEAQQTSPGAPLSESVMQALDMVVETVLLSLAGCEREGEPFGRDRQDRPGKN
jgi:hydrogenase maturation protease